MKNKAIIIAAALACSSTAAPAASYLYTGLSNTGSGFAYISDHLLSSSTYTGDQKALQCNFGAGACTVSFGDPFGVTESSGLILVKSSAGTSGANVDERAFGNPGFYAPVNGSIALAVIALPDYTNGSYAYVGLSRAGRGFAYISDHLLSSSTYTGDQKALQCNFGAGACTVSFGDPFGVTESSGLILVKSSAGTSGANVDERAFGNPGFYAPVSGSIGLAVIALPNAAAVPEPATWMSMTLGLGILGAAMRRRRRSTGRGLI